MKKIFTVIFLLMVSVSLISGCGGEKGSDNQGTEVPLENVNTVMLDKIENIDSVHIDKKIYMEIGVSETKQIYTEELRSDISVKDRLVYSDGVTQEDQDHVFYKERYVEETDEKVIAYYRVNSYELTDEDSWRAGEWDSYENDIEVSKSFLRTFKCTQSEEIEYNGVDAYRAKGVVDKTTVTNEEIEVILNEFDGMSLSFVDMDKFKKNFSDADEVEVELIYDAETLLPLEIKYNVLPLVNAFYNSLSDGSGDGEISLDEASCTYKFSNFNNVSVSIPDAIKTETVEYLD